MRLLAPLALLVFVLAGCSELGPGEIEPVPTAPVTTSDLETARATWDALGADSYTFSLQRDCFCDPNWQGPFEVRVSGGEVTSVRFRGDSLPVDRARSIGDLFDLLQEALDEGAASVRAAFDSDTGAPLTLSVDYSVEIADEEVGYRVGDLDLD